MKGDINMCKLGDIIVIKEFKNEYGQIIPKHSFVIINDEEDYIEGFKYDFIANMLCSFHSNEHKKRKLLFKENLIVKEEKIRGKNINSKLGYIKADQLYYFDKKELEYKVIAHMDLDLLDELVQLILLLKEENMLKPIYTNLTNKDKNVILNS